MIKKGEKQVNKKPVYKAETQYIPVEMTIILQITA